MSEFEEWPSTVGARIRRRRRELKIPQYELASRLGVSSPTVSEWESEKKIPSRERWSDIATALSSTIEKLFSNAEDPLSQIRKLKQKISDEDVERIVKERREKISRSEKETLVNFAGYSSSITGLFSIILNLYDDLSIEVGDLHKLPDEELLREAKILSKKIDDSKEFRAALVGGSRAVLTGAKFFLDSE